MQAWLKRKYNDKKYWRDLCWCETRVLNGNWIKENLSSYINTKNKKSDYQKYSFYDWLSEKSLSRLKWVGADWKTVVPK